MAEDLAPDKSLQRINDKVGFIFTNVTLAGTILTGAGIVTSLGSTTSVNHVLLIVVITFVFAAVAAALVANLPCNPIERSTEPTLTPSAASFSTRSGGRAGLPDAP